MSLNQLKEKARRLKVTVNDVFVGSVVKAIKDISKNTEEEKVLLQFVMATAPTDKCLKEFKPCNEVTSASASHNFKESLDE